MPPEITALQQPLKDGAIRTVNFFNGRLLTGADLSREQAARRQADGRIGLAIGDGIASGLEVSFAGSASVPTVTVAPGVAVNRLGATLVVPARVTLALNQVAPAGEDSVACLFGDCAPASAGGSVHGAGLYLLTIAPAFTTEGRAPVSGTGDIPGRCAVDATVEGVQFRRIEIRQSFLNVDFSEPDPADSAKSILRRNLRNAIAYRCFGSGVLPAWPSNLLAQPGRVDDLLEALRGYGLDDQEVPLALIAFDSSGGHLFTDNWSVRRPIDQRDPQPVFAALAEPRRDAVGRAMFRQFQDEIEELPNLAATAARDRFAFLPPAGFLPELSDAQVARFFDGMTIRGPMHIDASAVEPLLRSSFAAPAIDTRSPHAIWFYRIAETRMSGTAADIAFFASGHLPYRANARFDLNHFNFANFALFP